MTRMTLLADDSTENPYRTNDFRQVVEVRRNRKTGVLRNVFHSSKPANLARVLWSCGWTQRNLQWAQVCVATYKHLPMMPTPVSPSEMARRWGCSHTCARNRIRSSWDWLRVSARHYVRSSWVDEASWVWRACRESDRPLGCLAAVNRLRDYTPAPDDPLQASSKSLADWLDMIGLQNLRKAGIIKSIQSPRDTHSMYYVPQNWRGVRQPNDERGCIRSYQSLPMMPTPVSPSEMARRWGCSHVWARNLILGSWDWVGVSARHYIHSSWVDEAGWVWKACLDAQNPMSCLAAVNRLRDYVPAPDDQRPAGEASLAAWMGYGSFARLRAIGILQPLSDGRDRHKIYYVPNH